MIIRNYATCETCGTKHILRIGLGGKKVQSHQFACDHCKEVMNVTFEMGEGTSCGANTIGIEQVSHAMIINLHPSFVFSKEDLNRSDAFPSLELGAQMVKTAIAARERSGLPLDGFEPENLGIPHVSFDEEWDALRATWSLTRNGKQQIADKRMQKHFAKYRHPDQPKGLAVFVIEQINEDRSGEAGIVELAVHLCHLFRFDRLSHRSSDQNPSRHDGKHF